VQSETVTKDKNLQNARKGFLKLIFQEKSSNWRSGKLASLSLGGPTALRLDDLFALLGSAAHTDGDDYWSLLDSRRTDYVSLLQNDL
jgi:hypothetical protein